MTVIGSQIAFHASVPERKLLPFRMGQDEVPPRHVVGRRWAWAFGGVGFAGAILVSACGSRGPLDYGLVVSGGSDASSFDASSVEANAPDAASEASTDPREAGPSPVD